MRCSLVIDTLSILNIKINVLFNENNYIYKIPSISDMIDYLTRTSPIFHHLDGDSFCSFYLEVVHTFQKKQRI